MGNNIEGEAERQVEIPQAIESASPIMKVKRRKFTLGLDHLFSSVQDMLHSLNHFNSCSIETTTQLVVRFDSDGCPSAFLAVYN